MVGHLILLHLPCLIRWIRGNKIIHHDKLYSCQFSAVYAHSAADIWFTDVGIIELRWILGEISQADPFFVGPFAASAVMSIDMTCACECGFLPLPSEISRERGNFYLEIPELTTAQSVSIDQLW